MEKKILERIEANNALSLQTNEFYSLAKSGADIKDIAKSAKIYDVMIKGSLL